MNRRFEITVNLNTETKAEAIEIIKSKFETSEVKCIENTRTSLQNRALHLYFRLLSEALNEAGMNLQKTVQLEIEWTPITVKEVLWRPLQKAYKLEHSTTRLKTGDIDKIYDMLNKVIGERTKVYVPFPSIDNMQNVDYN